MEGIFEVADMTQFGIAQLNADRFACINNIKVYKEALAAGITHYSEGHKSYKVGVRLSLNTEILRAIDKELLRRQDD